MAMHYLETDREVWPWVFGVLHGEPSEAGGFLKSFAECITKADPDNYLVLRPVALQLRDRYPSYRCGCDPSAEIDLVARRMG